MLRFYEFFAGGGMARAGLAEHWRCLFANDAAAEKKAAYLARWGAEHFDDRDIRDVQTHDLPEHADLAWASFPCQDLSIAGAGRGIGRHGDAPTRSGALWPFFRLMAQLREEGRLPKLLVLENVVGLLSSNSGADFKTICEELGSLDYQFGAVVVDAKHFTPQSRPRVFVIAAADSIVVPKSLVKSEPAPDWHSPAVIRARAAFTAELSQRWRWWDLGEVPQLPEAALLEAIDTGERADWNSQAETDRLLGMMSPNNAARLDKAVQQGGTWIGSLYLRMRPGQGRNVQRAEITFNNTLGCLRTPRGGASRPRIIVIHEGIVRTRLLSPREAACLMGLPSDYPLPQLYQNAFQLLGDGVVVPVVRFLADRLLEPLLSQPLGGEAKDSDEPDARLAAAA